VLGQHGVSLTPEAVETTSAAGTAQLLWIAIERIDVTSMAIYFFLAETRGYIIPRHSFAHDAEYHTFEQLANQYHTAARQQSIPANKA